MTRTAHMIDCLVTRQLWNGGASVKEIANTLDRAESTVRRRLKITGVTNLKHPKSAPPA